MTTSGPTLDPPYEDEDPETRARRWYQEIKRLMPEFADLMKDLYEAETDGERMISGIRDIRFFGKELPLPERYTSGEDLCLPPKSDDPLTAYISDVSGTYKSNTQ